MEGRKHARAAYAARAAPSRKREVARKPQSKDETRSAVTAVEYAIALIASRSLPERKLREKLARRYDAGETGEAIVRMRELGYVDDVAWAERYVRDRFERSDKGRGRIRSELAAKGIAAASIDAALGRVLDPDAERRKAARVLDQMRTRLDRVRSAQDVEAGDDARDDTGDGSTADSDAGSRSSRVAQNAKNRLFRRMLARGYPVSLVRDLLGVS